MLRVISVSGSSWVSYKTRMILLLRDLHIYSTLKITKLHPNKLKRWIVERAGGRMKDELEQSTTFVQIFGNIP